MQQFQNALVLLPFRMPLIIVSSSGAKRWGIDSLLLELQHTEKILWFSRIDSNPTQQTVARARQIIKGKDIDGIVAIGGGSAMDLAKQVSAFSGMKDLKAPGALIEAVKEKSYLKNKDNAIPVIAVPTTAGTGSEVTQWATLWDSDSGMKYSVDAPWLKPKTVWMVPELTVSLPAKLTLAAGLDAVCQAVEAYWARETNPLSKALSIRSIQLITESLISVLLEPDNLRLRESLCTASLIAGLSFSQTKTTACHSISYPLTAQFGIEHGFAVAITLAPVAAINAQKVDITEIEALFMQYGGIQNWLDTVCGNILTLRLSNFGITKADLGGIVECAFTGGRMDNNPVDLSPGMVKDILTTVL